MGQETWHQLLHCFDLLEEIAQGLNQTHLGLSNLLGLWPWANHFVFLSFNLLTKTMGIVMRYKWKGLEQHMTQRRSLINPVFPPFLPPSLPSFLPSTCYKGSHEILYLELGPYLPYLICKSKTLWIGIWFQVQKLEGEAQPNPMRWLSSESSPGLGDWVFSDWLCRVCVKSAG